MRLFIAIELPDAWRAAADATRVALHAQTTQPPGSPLALRWVAPARLHVTLRFLGDVDAATLDPLIAALVERVPPVDAALSLAPAGTFSGDQRGDGGRVHTVWLGVRDDAAALAALSASIEDAGRAAGLPPDLRPLRAHLTLARVAPRATHTERRAIAHAVAQLDPPPAHATHIRAITLVHSHLGAPPYHMVRYEPLARIA